MNSYKKKLMKAREVLFELYSSLFMATLALQATNMKDRYRTKPHVRMQVGDNKASSTE